MMRNSAGAAATKRAGRLPGWALLAGSASAAMAVAAPVDAYAQAAATPSIGNEIVVTAQRRAERLEDVPMAVTAITAESIANANILNLHEIGQVSAGTQVSYGGAFTQPSIRGVTTLTMGNGVENNVAIYIDGFYEASTTGINMELANLASIEVLKGPQGTLYGRNATGGAILINTLAPSETLTGRFDLSYATYNDKRASAYVSGPLGDNLRLGVAAAYRDHDGFHRLIDRTVLGRTTRRVIGLNEGSVRTKLEADLGERTTATLAYNYGYNDNPGGAVYSNYDYPAAFLPAPPLRATRLGEVSFNFEPHFENERHQGTLTLRRQTGIGTLTSYTGYSYQKDRAVFDFDGTFAQLVSFDLAFDQESFQQSADFNIDAIDRLNLVIGGMYYWSDVRSPDDHGTKNIGVNGTISTNTFAATGTSAYSFFADATYQLTDALSLNAGGRYSHDKKTLDMTVIARAGVPDPSLPFVLPPTHRETSFSKFTPRASLRYEIAPRTNVYASWSRGFRSGTYNVSPVTSPDLLVATRPETITAYEIGVKTAQRDVRFDMAAFYYDYSDLNVSVTVPNAACPPGQSCVPVTNFGNAPAAEIYGIDFQVGVTPIERLNVTASGAWLHGRYTDFGNATGTGLDIVTGRNLANQSQDWGGQQMARAPDFSANLSLDYTVPLGAGELLASSNVSYTDSYVISNPSLYGPAAGSLAGRQRYRQKGYALVNASLTWTLDSGLSIGVFARNLTDKLYRATYNGSALGDYSAIAARRSIGGRLGYKF
jgi:iron complex outermembrane receptor protein